MAGSARGEDLFFPASALTRKGDPMADPGPHEAHRYNPIAAPVLHHDEPAEVAKRVAGLEARVKVLETWLSNVKIGSAMGSASTSTAPDPLADPPKMLRGRDRGEKP